MNPSQQPRTSDLKSQTSFRLILASSSPQRKKILTDAGYAYEPIDPGEVENAIAAAPSPDALAIAKARAKAMAVAAKLTAPFPAVVVGVDTLVALGDDVLGKPLDHFDATGILTRLSGSRHQVISGICLWPVTSETELGEMPRGTPVLASDTTWVKMRTMSPDDIEAYVASGEPEGKAGAYAIQEEGDKFVESLEGSFLNVVGFPLELFEQILSEEVQKWSF